MKMEVSEQQNESSSFTKEDSVGNNMNMNMNMNMNKDDNNKDDDNKMNKGGKKKKNKVRRMISGKLSATKTILLTKLLQRHRRLDCDNSDSSDSESELQNVYNNNNYKYNGGHRAIEQINQQMVNNPTPTPSSASGKLSPTISPPSSPPRIESSIAPKLKTNDNFFLPYLPNNNDNNNNNKKVEEQLLTRTSSTVNYHIPTSSSSSSTTNDQFVSPLRDLLTPSIYGGFTPDAESVDSSKGVNQPYCSGHSFADVPNDAQSSLGSFDDNEAFPITTSPETPQTQTSLSNMDLVKKIDESPIKDDHRILLPILHDDDPPHLSSPLRLPNTKNHHNNTSTTIRETITSKRRTSMKEKQTTKPNYNQQKYMLILPILITTTVTISAISTIASMVQYQKTPGENGILYSKIILHINSPPAFITFIASLLTLFFGIYIPIQTKKMFQARQELDFIREEKKKQIDNLKNINSHLRGHLAGLQLKKARYRIICNEFEHFSSRGALSPPISTVVATTKEALEKRKQVRERIRGQILIALMKSLLVSNKRHLVSDDQKFHINRITLSLFESKMRHFPDVVFHNARLKLLLNKNGTSFDAVLKIYENVYDDRIPKNQRIFDLPF